jgi:hypothetical protein
MPSQLRTGPAAESKLPTRAVRNHVNGRDFGKEVRLAYLHAQVSPYST